MAKNKKLEFDIRGMTCESCAAHVEKSLASIPGVAVANVPGWESGKATVRVEGRVEIDDLVQSVQKAGYSASPVGNGNGSLRAKKRSGSLVLNDGGGIHLMVIGGGSAGFAAAIKGAELGYRVALVEGSTIGGTCVNVGCVPSKALIRAMEYHHLSGEQRFRGVNNQQADLNWQEVVAHKNELVDELRQAKYTDVLAGYPEVEYIQGYARLTGENNVEIDGQSYSPDRIVITTGAQPWAPPIPGLKDAGYLTSATAMELEELPGSMIVLGANAVGLEQAQIFSRAGVKVTILELMPEIAPFEDEEISQALAEYLKEEGIEVFTVFSTQNVEKNADRYILTGEIGEKQSIFEAESLLVATGRRPNTSGMGLQAAGVELGKRGEILVDETMQSSNPYVYAAGDVTGQDMFVYTAAYGGSLAVKNALLGSGEEYDAHYIARVTFTDPQVASAGLTEAQAREQGYEVKVSTLPMEYVPRALAARDTRGMVKLIADVNTDKLLGAHILAPEGGEMIQLASMALKLGLTIAQLREMIFPYLTNVEGLKLATLAFDKDVAMLSCCAG
ncbi:MAG: mercury(II) reductase [Chloroflexi bacterium]|nr:mercury(II) reductase [Chloroflexota bacterium]